MKKYDKAINILILGIAFFAFIACLAGLLIQGGVGEREFKSIHGEVVKIYGYGLYQDNSIAVVAQGKASDLFTLVVGIPLLLISLYFLNKGSFRARLILTGTLGYFLYTYISYTFLWMYNPFFIVYVILMTLSLYAFILSIISFDISNMKDQFNERLPVKLLGGFQLFIGFAIGMLWLGKLAPSIFDTKVPVGLEHYSTLVIQGMDLGIVVPTAFVSGILLIKKKSFGYLLSSVIIIKGITMLTCISMMIINQALNQVDMGITEVLIFPALNCYALLCFIILMKHVNGNKRVLSE